MNSTCAVHFVSRKVVSYSNVLCTKAFWSIQLACPKFMYSCTDFHHKHVSSILLMYICKSVDATVCSFSGYVYI